MNSILLVLQKPATDGLDERNRWNVTIDSVRKKLLPSAEVEELGEGILLLRASSGLPVLGIALAVAERERLAYRVLFLDAVTEWARVPGH